MSLIELDGAITPITVRLLDTAIARARTERAQALVVMLNTPGGLERSMRSMVQSILNSDIPVIVYVGPTGARAASAGVFITMAGHVAAMAPATNIGAAHPVAAGGGQMDKEMSKKVENDAAAFARSIATERGRNVEWAEQSGALVGVGHRARGGEAQGGGPGGRQRARSPRQDRRPCGEDAEGAP